MAYWAATDGWRLLAREPSICTRVAGMPICGTGQIRFWRVWKIKRVRRGAHCCDNAALYSDSASGGDRRCSRETPLPKAPDKLTGDGSSCRWLSHRADAEFTAAGETLIDGDDSDDDQL